MSIADRIYETVKALTEPSACKVLDLAESLKAKQNGDDQAQKQAALATLIKYRGRFKAEKFNRDECYDR
jgi:hypothetical protein